MQEYESKQTFKISRGTIFFLENDKERPYKEWIGREVLIDGKRRLIEGIERPFNKREILEGGEIISVLVK